jgi:hypothetical protein
MYQEISGPFERIARHADARHHLWLQSMIELEMVIETVHNRSVLLRSLHALIFA